MPSSLSHQGSAKPKSLFVSCMRAEWCTRCMSGVTMILRSTLSSSGRIRTFVWLNSTSAWKTVSKIATASTGAPTRTITANFTSVDNTTWSGWKRTAVETSHPRPHGAIGAPATGLGRCGSPGAPGTQPKSNANNATTTATAYGTCQMLRKPRLALPHGSGHGDSSGWEQQAHQHDIEDRESEGVAPPHAPGESQLPARRQQFPSGERHARNKNDPSRSVASWFIRNASTTVMEASLRHWRKCVLRLVLRPSPSCAGPRIPSAMCRSFSKSRITITSRSSAIAPLRTRFARLRETFTRTVPKRAASSSSRYSSRRSLRPTAAAPLAHRRLVKVLCHSAGRALQGEVVSQLHQVPHMLTCSCGELKPHGGMLAGELADHAQLEQEYLTRRRGRAGHDMRAGAECGCEAENVALAVENLEDLFTAVHADAGELYPARGKDVEVAATLAFDKDIFARGKRPQPEARHQRRQRRWGELGKASDRFQQVNSILKFHFSTWPSMAAVMSQPPPDTLAVHGIVVAEDYRQGLLFCGDLDAIDIGHEGR